MDRVFIYRNFQIECLRFVFEQAGESNSEKFVFKPKYKNIKGFLFEKGQANFNLIQEFKTDVKILTFFELTN